MTRLTKCLAVGQSEFGPTHISKRIISIVFIFIIGVTSVQAAEIGGASYYADKFDGRKTASGAIFRQNKLTAAHRKLPFGTRVRVTNLGNNKTVEVIVNDRGPFSKNRIIDLSRSGAEKLDFIRQGVAKVRVEVLGAKREKKKSYSQKAPKPVLLSGHQHSRMVSGGVLANAPVAEYYQVTTKKISPTGFGVQVASYREAANLIKHCDDIRNKINENVFVQIGSANGQKIYRIIVGNFPNRQQADSFSLALKNKFTSRFVISF